MNEAGAVAEIRVEAWMELAHPEMTVEEGVAELEAVGNTILEVDYPGRRIKVLDLTETL